MKLKDKWLCEECGEVCTEYLTATNPFDDINTIIGCPSCKCVDTLVGACWKCNAQAEIGMRHMEHRYIYTCGKHRPPDAPYDEWKAKYL